MLPPPVRLSVQAGCAIKPPAARRSGSAPTQWGGVRQVFCLLAQPGSPRLLAGTHRERQGDGAGTVTSRRAAFLHRQLRTSISVQLPVCRAFSHQARAQILHATRARGVRQGAPRGCTPSPAGSGALTQRCIPALCGATALLRGRGRSTGSPPTEGLLQATGAPASLPCGPEQPSAPPPPAARLQQPPLPQLPPPSPGWGRGAGAAPREPPATFLGRFLRWLPLPPPSPRSLPSPRRAASSPIAAQRL